MRPRTGTRSEKGATLIEAAFAVVVFGLLVFGIIDVARVQYARTRLQYAVSQAGRFAITGQTMADPDNPSVTLTRKEAIVRRLRSLAGITDLKNADVVIESIDALGNVSQGPGGPGDVVVVRAQYAVPMVAPVLGALFADKSVTITCSASFRNEEFPSTSPTPSS